MCEFCTKHGDGKVWYRNASNYSHDLVSDLKRRKYIGEFFEAAIQDGFNSLGRLEALYSKKGRLPAPLLNRMVEKAKAEHFGQVLPMEEVRELVMKADSIVRMPCACRWTAARKEARCCYGISFGPEAWYKDLNMEYFGKAPGEGLESLKKDEAVSQMEKMEADGAIHTIWTLMTPFIGSICNCTAQDCIAMRTLSGIGVETMARAEYAAVVEEGLCEGCGSCEEQCQFGAVGSVRRHGVAVAVVDPLRCFGCGLCRNVCPTGAISLAGR